MADGQTDMDRKKAEVRARLEAQSQSKKKKGFMTPERKKKLRLLLRKKAAEELKKEQERKAAERRRVIDERCGRAKGLDGLGEGDVRTLCQTYYTRICQVETAKYDMEKEVEFKDYQINELNIAVNDLRGKFIKPTLKKVSKYENKFAKLQKKAAEFNFRNQLKTVKKKEFTMDEEEPGKRPDWAMDKDGKAIKAGLDLPATSQEDIGTDEGDRDGPRGDKARSDKDESHDEMSTSASSSSVPVFSTEGSAEVLHETPEAPASSGGGDGSDSDLLLHDAVQAAEEVAA